MVNNERRDDLLNNCMQSLRAYLGRHVSLARLSRRSSESSPVAQYRLAFPDGRSFRLAVSAWPTLRPSVLASVEEEITRWGGDGAACDAFLVVSAYVSESVGAKLRKLGVWFADAAGNAYLEIPGALLLFVVGRRPAPSPSSKARWMSEQGAKILYELLACGPLVEATYRDVEESTGVSLGMISKLVSEWVKDGLLERRGRGTYEIVHGMRLLDMWVRAYADTLHPKIALGRFRPLGRSDLSAVIAAAAEEMALDHLTVGGEFAADQLTNGTTARSLRLYVPEEERGRVQRAFQLVPSPEGSVEICEAFAGDIGRMSDELGIRIAHPALVFAELLETDDARLGKQALAIRKRHLAWIR